MIASLPQVLCVDDEPQVLEGLGRVLRKKVKLSTSPSADAALARLDAGESYEVIISDMRMPGMNGATLLAKFHERAPDTVRMLLTGYAEMDAAIAAVNEGHIFRFLTKPCPPEVLLPALDAAVAQHRLVTSERVLLEQTLLGSVRALTEALALARPESFREVGRRHERVRAMAQHLKIADAWHVEVASMLACVGYVLLPVEVVVKVQTGAPLDVTERGMLARLPEVAERVLSHIPRIENVRAVLEHYGNPKGPGKNEPVGAGILRIVRDLAIAEAREGDTLRAIAAVKSSGLHARELVDAMGAVCEPRPPELRSLRLDELRTGMLLGADVKAQTGLLLVGRGQRVTAPLIERLRNFALRVGIVEPIVCETETASA